MSFVDPVEVILSSHGNLYNYYQGALSEKEIREYDSTIQNYHSRIIRCARDLSKESKSEIAYLILSNVKPSLAQCIIDDDELIKSIRAGISDEAGLLQLLRPIEILTRIFQFEEIEIKVEKFELYKAIVEILRYCRYSHVQELFEILLITAPHTDEIQELLYNAGIIQRMTEYFNAINSLNVEKESDERIIYGMCMITSYLARSSRLSALVFDGSFITPNVLFYLDGMSDFLQNARWTMLNSLLNETTEGLFVSGGHNFLQECAGNLGKAVSGSLPEYIIKCIAFLQYFLANHAGDMIVLDLPAFFVEVMNNNPNHFYLVSAIKDFFFQAIRTPPINEQISSMIKYFAEVFFGNNYNLRGFAIEVLVYLREESKEDEALAQLVLASIPGDDRIWSILDEIGEICSTRATGI